MKRLHTMVNFTKHLLPCITTEAAAELQASLPARTTSSFPRYQARETVAVTLITSPKIAILGTRQRSSPIWCKSQPGIGRIQTMAIIEGLRVAAQTRPPTTRRVLASLRLPSDGLSLDVRIGVNKRNQCNPMCPCQSRSRLVMISNRRSRLYMTFTSSTRNRSTALQM